MQHKEVVNLSLKDLVPYEAQPFHVIDDEAMTEKYLNEINQDLFQDTEESVLVKLPV